MSLKINQVVLSRDYFFESSEGIEENAIISYLAVLKRIAQIGGVTQEEEDFESTIISYLGLDASVATKAISMARETPLETLVENIEDKALRVCLFRDTYKMALADQEISKDEMQSLDQVAEYLSLSQEQTAKIIEFVDSELKLLKDFSTLVKDMAS